MRLIVGLGNPGKKYANTRHNLGFMVLDKIVTKEKYIPFRLEGHFNAEITQTGGIGHARIASEAWRAGENRIIFAKPHTFMNMSGDAVSKLLGYYKIGTDDLLVISDDINQELGAVRIRMEGSSGGHKGLESIIQKIGDNRFIRVRIGIGENKNIPSEKYVLEKFSKNEQKIIARVVDKTADLVLNWAKSGELKEETITISS